jgi:hypothetical protein
VKLRASLASSRTQDFVVGHAYALADFDNDGDLDILANSAHGPYWFYRNNETKNNAILFQFEDRAANRYCIGCKVTIHYGSKAQRSQMRELKSGGGFHSFDEPVLHFGLGAHEAVDRVEVQWSTGEVTKIEGPLPANALYTVSRAATAPKPGSEAGAN